jgi:hypothetical protein
LDCSFERGRKPHLNGIEQLPCRLNRFLASTAGKADSDERPQRDRLHCVLRRARLPLVKSFRANISAALPRPSRHATRDLKALVIARYFGVGKLICKLLTSHCELSYAGHVLPPPSCTSEVDQTAHLNGPVPGLARGLEGSLERGLGSFEITVPEAGRNQD